MLVSGITIGRVVTARGDWRKFAWRGRDEEDEISYPEKMVKSLQLIWSAS